MDSLRTGWLSPSGEFFPAPYGRHIDYAYEIAACLHLPDYDFNTERRIHADEKLINSGYVLIGRSHFWSGWRIEWSLYHTLTPEQRIFLSPYFDDKSQIETSTYMRWEVER